MKLSNIRRIGRFVNPETGRPVNVHTGRNRSRGTDNLFFYRSGKREFISDRDFFSPDMWKKVPCTVPAPKEIELDRADPGIQAILGL